MIKRQGKIDSKIPAMYEMFQSILIWRLPDKKRTDFGADFNIAKRHIQLSSRLRLHEETLITSNKKIDEQSPSMAHR